MDSAGDGTSNVSFRPKQDWLLAAAGLGAVIESSADEAEQLRHQSPAVVSALRAAGLYRLLLPQPLGGEETTFVDAMRAVEQLAYSDGSAGWCAMVANVAASSVGAYLPDGGADHVFGSGPDVLIAGQGVPRGQARRAEGGYLVRGTWSYGSGIYFADLIHCGCLLMDGDKPEIGADGIPISMLVHFDPKEISLLDNWNTLGLRGTGSFDYALKSPEIFVPEHMCYRYAADRPLRGGNQYSVGLIGFTTWGHSAWALGMGRRILDEIAGIARGKTGPFGPLGSSASFKHAYADAEARYRSARAFCYECWSDLDCSLGNEDRASLAQVALVRIAMRHLHDVVSDIATFAHRSAGGVSLRPSVLQRCYRDVHSGTQHVLLSDQILEEGGRVLLGMTGEKARWGIFGVLE